jgi:hypothetical protein
MIERAGDVQADHHEEDDRGRTMNVTHLPTER